MGWHVPNQDNTEQEVYSPTQAIWNILWSHMLQWTEYAVVFACRPLDNNVIDQGSILEFYFIVCDHQQQHKYILLIK